MKQRLLKIGDRVVLASEDDQKRLHAMANGQIVYYNGRHSPANPRVRWASGWGVSSKATTLRLMTEEEKAANPPPQLIDRDHGFDLP